MAEHPWQITLAEFIAAAGARGLELRRLFLPTAGGGPWPYLVGEHGEVAVLPGYLDDEDVLTPDVLRALCRDLGLPPEDFGLAADD